MNFVQIQRTSRIEQLLKDALEIDDRNSNDYKQIENAFKQSSSKYISANIVLAAHRLAGEKDYLHEIFAGLIYLYRLMLNRNEIQN